MTASALRPPFRVGSKEIYLPNFFITLLRTKLPANQAKFGVPLWFSKLDLRDYLYHVYNVRIISARSYVKQSRIQQGLHGITTPIPRRWHRPRATKSMIVELERPFVWPERPQDFSEWNREEMRMGDAEGKERQKEQRQDADALGNEERAEALREQAQALLDGREKWRPPAQKYVGRMMRGSG